MYRSRNRKYNTESPPMPNTPKTQLQTVRMITFGGGYSLPAWVAKPVV